MKLNDQVIKKNNKNSFLICFNNLIRFYKKFGWRIMPKKNFRLLIMILIVMECILAAKLLIKISTFSFGINSFNYKRN